MKNDVVTLISRNGVEKIVCFKYMEECFRNQGYVSSKNIFINFFYKLSNSKILKKIRIFLSIFLRSKFIFKNPEQNEFVILDDTTSTSIEKILPNKNYIIISTRVEQIKEIYVSKKILFHIIKNFFKYGVKKNYLIALIKLIRPKVVVTHIHDSEDFHFISKMMNNEITFVAIQVYSPSMFKLMFSNESKKKYFIPNFFCYGEYDQLFYQKKNVQIKNFEAVGSIKSSLTNEYVNSKKLKINPNKYDICLISEAQVALNADWPHVKNLADCYGLVAEFTFKLCKKHNLNIIFAGKAVKGSKAADREICFYKNFLKEYDFKIDHYDSKNAYNSYINIMQSKLTIALFSTILREAISFEKKILSFNTARHPDIEFPGPDIEFAQDSICVLKEPSYELFEERVLKILSMSNNEYFSKLGREKSFLMKPTINTASVIRKKIKEFSEGTNTN